MATELAADKQQNLSSPNHYVHVHFTATLLQPAPILTLAEVNSEAEYSLTLCYTNSTAQAETLFSSDSQQIINIF